MAVRHIIRNNKGETKTVSLTPRTAILAFCYECVGWNWYEVEKCVDDLCPLYPFRNRGATKGSRPWMKTGVQPPQLRGREPRESKKEE